MHAFLVSGINWSRNSLLRRIFATLVSNIPGKEEIVIIVVLVGIGGHLRVFVNETSKRIASS